MTFWERCPGLNTKCFSLFLSMMFEMGFGRVGPMLKRLLAVAICNMSMVTGFLGSAGYLVLGRFLMVTSSLLVMLSGFFVVVCGFF